MSRHDGHGVDAVPRVAEYILALCVSKVDESIVGDLAEEYREWRRSRGATWAWSRYWRDVLGTIPPVLRRHVARRRRARRRSSSVAAVTQDLRFALRALGKKPSFAVVTIATLSLAIAVNTAVFSLVNGVVFADLPMDDPESVVFFRSTNFPRGIQNGPFSYAELLSYREQATSFESLAAWRNRSWILTGAQEPVRVLGFEISANFLEAWGIGTIHGRSFAPTENLPGAPRVAMLSDGFWNRHFGGDEGVIGSTVRLDRIEYTVVGIVSPKMEYASLGEVDLWVAMQEDRATVRANDRNLAITGRLKRGVTSTRAGEEVGEILARLTDADPATHRDWGVVVETAPESMLDDETKATLSLLMIGVGLLLLIACVNVANMFLVAGTGRRREMAVRSVLGAHRSRLVRQLLTEAFVVAVIASVGGVLLSRGLMKSLVLITNGREEAFTIATLDGNVLLFTTAVCIATVLIFGLLPALRTSGPNASDVLKGGGTWSDGGRKGNRMTRVLVASQIGLALMLVVPSGLLTRSIIKFTQRDAGFEPADVLTMRVARIHDEQVNPAMRRQLLEDVVAQLAALPGVVDVGLASSRPSTEPSRQVALHVEGQSVSNPEGLPSIHLASASPGFFQAVRIPLVRGRVIAESDTDRSAPVALINQEAARRYWPGEDPVGRRVRFKSAGPWTEIIGIVGDVRTETGDGATPPQAYRPLVQGPPANTVVFVRTTSTPTGLAVAARRAIRSLDAAILVEDVKTMNQAIYQERSMGYALIGLFVSFAAFALFIAAIGIYGVTSHAVSRRAAEIGIRIALGAEHGHVRRMVLRQGGVLVLIGGLVGLLGAFAISQLMATAVFGISTLDPLTFVGAPLVLIAVGLFASYVPARRATQIAPMDVLRAE